MDSFYFEICYTKIDVIKCHSARSNVILNRNAPQVIPSEMDVQQDYEKNTIPLSFYKKPRVSEICICSKYSDPHSNLFGPDGFDH